LKVYRLNPNEGKYFFKGTSMPLSLLLSLLFNQKFCDLLRTPYLTDSAYKTKVIRECKLSLEIEGSSAVQRKWICVFNSEEDARAVLAKTDARNHPKHKGMCFGVLDESDPSWK